jgi:16S rRNA processing protein RimM
LSPPKSQPPDRRPGADGDDCVVFGRVLGPFGVKGWIKVQTFTTEQQTLLEYPEWWLRPRGGVWQKRAIESAREHGATLLAQLAGVVYRDAAVALKGSDIGVPRGALPVAAENEIYYSDLVGLEVVNRQAECLGQVAAVQDYGAHPVLRVADAAAGTERMIPFVAAYVDRVDIAARRIEVDWLPDY